MKDVSGVKGGPIQGVVIKNLNRIKDERGWIYHMLRRDDEIFEGFGEIYFSVVHPKAIKGWHSHKKMTLHYAVVHGMIRLVLYDDRAASPTKGNLMEVLLGEENYVLVKIPPGVWNGFTGLGDTDAIVANCATIPHDPGEIERMDPFSKDIPYDWEIKNE